MHKKSEISYWCQSLLPFFMFDLLHLHDMYRKGTTTRADLNLNTSKMPILILQRQQR